MYYYEADGIPLSVGPGDVSLAWDTEPPRPTRPEFADSEGVQISRHEFERLIPVARAQRRKFERENPEAVAWAREYPRAPAGTGCGSRRLSR